mmetsp:Transcript_16444/g.31161  ORF Transcript_16444/g.31161 Transcript_16444/m.31161 type:complete len:711 (+) Transcript_16444:80-2212(+)
MTNIPSRRPSRTVHVSSHQLLKKGTTFKGKRGHNATTCRHLMWRTTLLLLVFFGAFHVLYDVSSLEQSSSLSYVDIFSLSNNHHDSSNMEKDEQKANMNPREKTTTRSYKARKRIDTFEEEEEEEKKPNDHHFSDFNDINRDVQLQSQSCLAMNTKDWLEKPRYGNLPGNYSHTEFPPMGNLLDHITELLDHQNVCHEQSLFRSMENGNSIKDEKLTIKIWKIRLMYLSFYYHQHEHAILEAKERMRLEAIHGSQQCQEEMRRYSVNSFDYECKNVKFLVAEVRNTGIGSVLKRDLFNIFMAGVALNRTVILYNAVKRGAKGDPDYFWSYPWQLASCPRQDYQCTFRPVSGCVSLAEDIFNATSVHHKDIEKFMHNEKVPHVVGRDDPPPEEHTRIIRYEKPDKKEFKVGPRFLARMNKIANVLIDQLGTDAKYGRIPILRKAAESILTDDDTKTFYKVEHEHSDAMIAFMMYFLRPRIDKAKLLEEFLQKDLPQGFDSTRTLGLPFRGSDKCNQESECLTFPTMMNLLKNRWLEEGFDEKFGQHGGKVTANVLITSELPNIMELARNFSANNLYLKKLPFHPIWITNTNDVHQGNGSTKRPILTGGATADDIILSILSSFKLQMNAATTIGNCCSNFHQTLFHLLRGGCGLHIENKGQCLQYRNESMYQLCCDVKYDKSCPEKRLERIRKEYNDEHLIIQKAEDKLWDL